MVSRTLENLDEDTSKKLSDGTSASGRAGRGPSSPTKEDRPRAKDAAELRDYVGIILSTSLSRS